MSPLAAPVTKGVSSATPPHELPDQRSSEIAASVIYKKQPIDMCRTPLAGDSSRAAEAMKSLRGALTAFVNRQELQREVAVERGKSKESKSEGRRTGMFVLG
jgi:hypothetical protein